jgi:hypothetical protein
VCRRHAEERRIPDGRVVGVARLPAVDVVVVVVVGGGAEGKDWGGAEVLKWDSHLEIFFGTTFVCVSTIYLSIIYLSNTYRILNNLKFISDLHFTNVKT